MNNDHNLKATRPIGIIDSGVGGLTVVKEILKVLPNENIIYLGDTARVPYGTRGKDVIKTFSFDLIDYILKQDVKLIVVACNTISATCLDELQKYSKVELLGVIEPAVDMIVKTTKNKNIGIIGTAATISSNVYQKKIKVNDPSIKVLAKPTSLFVPIVEEGFSDSKIAKLTAEKYLSDFKEIDTLHLACTHYPLLRNTIQKVLKKNVEIIDSAKPTANELKRILIREHLLNLSGSKPYLKLYFTDLSENTLEVVRKFMGEGVNLNINKINIHS